MSGEELVSKGGGPGPVLASAREEIGVSQREVAEALNLPLDTINAIEVGDLERLPSDVFARGYVRAYAKLLELDPDPLVASLELESNEVQAVISDRPTTQVLTLPKPSLEQLKIGGAVIAAGLLILIASFYFTADEETAEVPAALLEEEAGVNQGQASGQDLPSSALRGDEATVMSSAATIIPASTDAATDAQGQGVAEAAGGVSLTAERSAPVDFASQSAGSLQAQGSGAGEAVRAQRLTPTGQERLTLVFSEDCWVSIKGADGEVLFGNLGKAGETLDFIGEAPFTLLLGYAQGVSVQYNSEPVPLTPHTRNNVASLVLGQ